MNDITRLIAATIVGLVLATLVAVVVLLSAGHAHAGELMIIGSQSGMAS